MFAPEGYVPFATILHDGLRDKFYDAAEEHVARNLNSWMGLAMRRRDDLIRTWVVSYIASECYLCSPEGKLIRFDASSLLGSLHFIDVVALGSDFKNRDLKAENYRQLFSEEVQIGFNLCTPLSKEFCDDVSSLVESYCNTSDDTQKDILDRNIRLKLQEGVQAEGYTRPFLFVNTLTGCVDLEYWRELEGLEIVRETGDETTVQEIRSTAHLLEKFEGWAVCVPKELWGHDWEAYCKTAPAEYQAWEDQGKQLDSETTPTRKGRPRKVDNAMLAYDLLYPHGHGAKTWPEVADEISERTRETIHHETLMKAINGRKRLPQQE